MIELEKLIEAKDVLVKIWKDANVSTKEAMITSILELEVAIDKLKNK